MDGGLFLVVCCLLRFITRGTPLPIPPRADVLQLVFLEIVLGAIFIYIYNIYIYIYIIYIKGKNSNSFFHIYVTFLV